ncbi:MAG: aminotransferase class IV [Parvibaculaceae bacterium]
MSATVWFNGALVKEPLGIEASERGLLLGDGIFETVAVFNRVGVWLEDHLDRLMAGAGALGLPADRDIVREAAAEVLREAPAAHGVLRITLTRGPGVRGLAAEAARPSLLVTLGPWSGRMLFAPAMLSTSSIRRNETSPASRLKTLSYIDNIIAAREAASIHCDDALFLNHRGLVASTTIANIFVLRDGWIATPRAGDGVLAGIVRKKLLGLADAEERPVTPQELLDAEAVFLTNSLRLVRPVHSLDGRPLGRNDAALARFFDMLCRMIAEETGLDPREVDAL